MVSFNESYTMPRLGIIRPGDKRSDLHMITLQQGSLSAELDRSPAGQSETDDAWRSSGTAEPGVGGVWTHDTPCERGLSSAMSKCGGKSASLQALVSSWVPEDWSESRLN